MISLAWPAWDKICLKWPRNWNEFDTPDVRFQVQKLRPKNNNLSNYLIRGLFNYFVSSAVQMNPNPFVLPCNNAIDLTTVNNSHSFSHVPFVVTV